MRCFWGRIRLDNDAEQNKATHDSLVGRLLDGFDGVAVDVLSFVVLAFRSLAIDS